MISTDARAEAGGSVSRWDVVEAFATRESARRVRWSVAADDCGDVRTDACTVLVSDGSSESIVVSI
jgi:hypothetical protein